MIWVATFHNHNSSDLGSWCTRIDEGKVVNVSQQTQAGRQTLGRGWLCSPDASRRVCLTRWQSTEPGRWTGFTLPTGIRIWDDCKMCKMDSLKFGLVDLIAWWRRWRERELLSQPSRLLFFCTKTPLPSLSKQQLPLPLLCSTNAKLRSALRQENDECLLNGVHLSFSIALSLSLFPGVRSLRLLLLLHYVRPSVNLPQR